jgi:integrase
MTTGEWLDEWLAGKRGLRDGTRDGYRIVIESWLRPHLGEVMLDRLRAEHLAALLDYWASRNEEITTARAEGRPVRPDPLDVRRRVAVIDVATQRKVMKILGNALNAAVRRRLLDRNPLDFIELPKATRQPVLVWTPSQVVAFLSSTTHDRLHALWQVALTAGLRRGELLNLTWADVDFENMRLAVTRSKTEAGRRVVSLTSETVSALRDHRKRQLRERLASHGAYDTAADLVFAQEDGSPIPPHRVTFGFQKLARAAGLPVMRFHGTRHTAATMMLVARVDTKIVSEQLGHSSTRVTTDIYQHVRNELRDDAASRVGDLLRQAAESAGS